MRTLNVPLRTPYTVFLAEGEISRLPALFSAKTGRVAAYLLTNRTIFSLHGKALIQSLHTAGITVHVRFVADTEKSKSWDTARSVLEDMARFGKDHSFALLAFGGGVVGDLGGFCASIYKRGIPYAHVPTTLLAQVDSAIGGKTGVDFPAGKNLAGTFYQPKFVFSEITYLRTLPQRQLANGIAEVIKYACIEDRELFSYLQKNCTAIMKKNVTALHYIVHRCSRIKARIVAQDEREEKGVRTILNFGHTIGHALETALRYRTILHGEAISIGMRAGCGLSVRKGLLPQETADEIEDVIRSYGLPLTYRNIPIAALLKAHHYDKKFVGTRNKFVLLKDIGQVTVVEGIPLEMIKAEIKKIAANAI